MYSKTVSNLRLMFVFILQGDEVVTMSMVVPTVLDLYTHLKHQKQEACYCKSLVAALSRSIMKRFKGIFVSCQMASSTAVHEEPFSHKVYLLAAVLDPQFCMDWVDEDVVSDESEELGPAVVKAQQREIKNMLEGEFFFISFSFGIFVCLFVCLFVLILFTI